MTIRVFQTRRLTNADPHTQDADTYLLKLFQESEFKTGDNRTARGNVISSNAANHSALRQQPTKSTKSNRHARRTSHNKTSLKQNCYARAPNANSVLYLVVNTNVWRNFKLGKSLTLHRNNGFTIICTLKKQVVQNISKTLGIVATSWKLFGAECLIWNHVVN